MTTRSANAATGKAAPATGHLPALETLRGLAITLVVLFHYYGILGGVPSPGSPLPLRWIAAGNTGVTLFFVLSGFLLARPFVAGLRDGRSPGMARFYRARAVRILPAYLVIVAVAWVVIREAALWKALVFMPLGMKAFPFALPWWSLCTEVQFYAVLPWLMLLPRSRPGRWLLAAGLFAWLGSLCMVCRRARVVAAAAGTPQRAVRPGHRVPGRRPARVVRPDAGLRPVPAVRLRGVGPVRGVGSVAARLDRRAVHRAAVPSPQVRLIPVSDGPSARRATRWRTSAPPPPGAGRWCSSRARSTCETPLPGT